MNHKKPTPSLTVRKSAQSAVPRSQSSEAVVYAQSARGWQKTVAFAPDRLQIRADPSGTPENSMPLKKREKMTPEEQLAEFQKAARKIATDDDPERFKERVRKIGSARSARKDNKPPAEKAK